ncbi:unnamed protein product [marine sediment metagenome]|uniref:Uncharacterized protein n=1 Tax=marine sediment metagenome TaxID=412755 RepID=X1LP98_9ZZZZ
MRVNRYLTPVELDYEKDVLPLTPTGNPTERHLCLAYAQKARFVFEDVHELEKFWAEKLSVNPEDVELSDRIKLLNLIRTRTMKQDGAGYVIPDKGDFPTMADTNRFILQAGGIPTHTWLNGFSDGEQEIEKLLKVAMQSGVGGLNIIPDRNYMPGVKDKRLTNLYHVVELAQKLNLIIVVGTEMNSPGQKFVDDFNSQELSPLLEVFLKGAYIVYAHSVLQQRAGLGYTSNWAKRNFENLEDKNEFFQKFGSLLKPEKEDALAVLSDDVTAQQILNKVGS